MILLRPIFKKTGNLIKGSIKYVTQWSQCVSSPNWSTCLIEQQHNYSLQNHFTVLNTIAQYQDVNRMSQGLGITPQVTLELLTNLYKYITTYFTVQEKESIQQYFKIFPDQTGKFQFAKDLSFDQGIEDAFKELCKKYYFQIANKLVMKEMQEAAQGFINTHSMPSTVFKIIQDSI